MSISIATFGLLLLIIIFLSLSLPLAFSTGLVGLIFALSWFGPSVLTLIVERVITIINSYSLVAVPMFVLMAAFLDRSGIAKDLFTSLNILSGKLRGGVAVQTIVVSFILAAMSGIIAGSIVLLGIIALPQMLRLGYDKKLAMGTICAGGALGTMVPPSIVLILYGLITQSSISDLFLATIPAAGMLTVLYIAYILISCYLKPELSGNILSQPSDKSQAQNQNFSNGSISVKAMIRNLGLPLIVIISVLGSIYGGIASVTEASAMGVLGVIMVIIIRKEFTMDVIKKSIFQTFNVCGMVIWIVIGASIIVGVYSLMGGADFVKNAIMQMQIPPLAVILFMMLILLILGMFLDWTGIVMLAMPVFIPIIEHLGYDKIWFGILFSINMQVAFMSPPFGAAAFCLKSVVPDDISLKSIFSSFLPFILIQLFVLIVIILFPGSILWIIK